MVVCLVLLLFYLNLNKWWVIVFYWDYVSLHLNLHIVSYTLMQLILQPPIVLLMLWLFIMVKKEMVGWKINQCCVFRIPLKHCGKSVRMWSTVHTPRSAWSSVGPEWAPGPPQRRSALRNSSISSTHGTIAYVWCLAFFPTFLPHHDVCLYEISCTRQGYFYIQTQMKTVLLFGDAT